MQSLKQALTQASIEIYGEDEAELRIAERHRFHLMDSGVTVRPEDGGFRVAFTVRAQRSDFARVEPGAIYERIRESLGSAPRDRKYEHGEQRVVEVQDPVDASRILDVWYELAFHKHVASTADAVEEVLWALHVEKYITP